MKHLLEMLNAQTLWMLLSSNGNLRKTAEVNQAVSLNKKELIKFSPKHQQNLQVELITHVLLKVLFSFSTLAKSTNKIKKINMTLSLSWQSLSCSFLSSSHSWSSSYNKLVSLMQSNSTSKQSLPVISQSNMRLPKKCMRISWITNIQVTRTNMRWSTTFQLETNTQLV